MKQSLSINNSSTESAPHSEQQLKYENERLKLALAQRYAQSIYKSKFYLNLLLCLI